MPKWHPSDGMGQWLDEFQPAAVEIDADETQPRLSRVSRSRHQSASESPRPVGPAEVLGQSARRRRRLAANRSAGRDHPARAESAFAVALRPAWPVIAALAATHPKTRCQPSTRPIACMPTSSSSTFAPRATANTFYFTTRLLDRTTNGKGPIRQATNDLVESLDAGGGFGLPYAGTHVPTLEAFLAAVPTGVSLYFDAKDITPQDLAASLDKFHLSDRTIAYQTRRVPGQAQANRQPHSPDAGRQFRGRSAQRGRQPQTVRRRYAVECPFTQLHRALPRGWRAGVRRRARSSLTSKAIAARSSGAST